MSGRPLPPFGRELRALLAADPRPWRWGANGDRAAITVAIGTDAWSYARAWHPHRLVLVVPPRELASRFDWSDCAGHDPVLLMQCGDVQDGEVERVARALMRDGAERVLELGGMAEYFAGRPDYAAA